MSLLQPAGGVRWIVIARAPDVAVVFEKEASAFQPTRFHNIFDALILLAAAHGAAHVVGRRQAVCERARKAQRN